MIRVGDIAKIKPRQAGLPAGEEYEITHIKSEGFSTHPYQLAGKMDVRRETFELYCSCGQKKLHHKTWSYICPWCEANDD